MAVIEYFAGLALAAPFGDIYFGLWGYNCVLACIAIGGMFYALTWQVHLLAITCGEYTPRRRKTSTKRMTCDQIFVIYDHLSQHAHVWHLTVSLIFSSAAFFCAYLSAAIANIMSTVSTHFLPLLFIRISAHNSY